MTLTWTCTIESDRTRLWAIGLRLRCLQIKGHSGVYQSRHRRYYLVSQRQTFQRESLLTWPLRCPWGPPQTAETVLNVILDTGEPDAVKVARPVRRGVDGKVPNKVSRRQPTILCADERVAELGAEGP